MPSPCPKGRRGALILIPSLFPSPVSSCVLPKRRRRRRRRTAYGEWKLAKKRMGKEKGECVWRKCHGRTSFARKKWTRYFLYSTDFLEAFISESHAGCDNTCHQHNLTQESVSLGIYWTKESILARVKSVSEQFR